MSNIVTSLNDIIYLFAFNLLSLTTNTQSTFVSDLQVLYSNIYCCLFFALIVIIVALHHIVPVYGLAVVAGVDVVVAVDYLSKSLGTV